jgi:hypothetical protein
MRLQDREQRAASLQGQLRRAGENIRAKRRESVRWLLYLVLAGPFSVCLLATVLPYRIDLMAYALATAAVAAAVLTVAVPAGALYRRIQREQFQKVLADLGPERAAEVLLPLRNEPLGDTRKLAEGLLRDLHLPPVSDLLPSAAPAGTGNEPGPIPAADSDRQVTG